MEDIKIRDYIINNFQDDDTETIKKAIEESIKEQDGGNPIQVWEFFSKSFGLMQMMKKKKKFSKY